MKNRGKNRQTYILTLDVGEKISAFNKFGIKAPSANDPIFREFEQELERRIKNALLDTEVVVIRTKEIAADIISKAFERKAMLKNPIIVSSCSEIARADSGWIESGHVINVNRLVNGKAKQIGIGSRPGHSLIEDQILGIRSVAMKSTFKSPLIIVEDGVYTGKTLCYLVEQFRKSGLNVDAIVIGFAFPKGLAAIKKEFDGEIVVVNNFHNLTDWIPDHDLVPFSQNCGKVLGVSLNGSLYPFYNYDGASYSFPYLVTFAPMDRWTSIPVESTASLSLFCLQWTLKLFNVIEKMNGRDIMIGDLLKVKPRVSIPISVNQGQFPDASVRVIDFLSDACHELA